MEIFVHGAKITLTADQVYEIEKVRRKRERCRNSFIEMLKHFGFKQIDTKDWENKGQICFTHTSMGWFADIIDQGNYSEVWMTGEGLKRMSGFPGGWVYGSPQEIEEEIVKALDKLCEKK